MGRYNIRLVLRRPDVAQWVLSAITGRPYGDSDRRFLLIDPYFLLMSMSKNTLEPFKFFWLVFEI